MKFREHGHDKPVVQLEDRAALEAYVREQFAPWPDLDGLDLANLKCERYGHIVFGEKDVWFLIHLPGYGVVGYATQPLDGESPLAGRPGGLGDV